LDPLQHYHGLSASYCPANTGQLKERKDTTQISQFRKQFDTNKGSLLNYCKKMFSIFSAVFKE